MQRQRRVAATAAVAVAGLAFTAIAGCSSSSGGSTASAGSSASSSKTDLSKTTFAFADANTSNDYHVTFQCGIVAAAKKDNITNLKIYGSTPHTATAQLPVLRSIAATRPDVLIIGSTDAEALTPTLKQMQQAGTKIIFYDAGVSDQSVGLALVQANNTAGGKLAADTLGKDMGGKGKVLVVGDTPGSIPTEDRIIGFQEEMKAKFPNIKLLTAQYDQESPVNDTTIVNAAVAANKDLTAIFPAYNEAAVGVIAALNSNHLQGKYKIVSFDADPTEVKFIENGEILAAVNQAPYAQADKAMQLAIDAAEGKKITQRTWQLAMPLITKANLSNPTVKDELYSATKCS